MRHTRSAEAAAFQSIKRACYAGLDSITLRREVGRRIAPLIPSDAYSISTVDPETGLFTHAVADRLPVNLMRGYIEYVYPQETATGILDQARSGETVRTAQSGLAAELFRSEGMEHEMRAVLCVRGTLWGSTCLLRGMGTPEFSEWEQGFMRRLAPHVARGLRAATLLESAREEEPPATGEPTLGAAPGVMVLDGRGRVQLRNHSAAMHLQDIADVADADAEVVPYAVASTVVRLRHRHARPEADQDGLSLGAELRVRGRSGRWYTIRASLAEPDAEGLSSTVIVIEPAHANEVAVILTRLYGLSPREREILALIAKGASTKQVAARLHLSAYTVQEHLGNACDKVGVRGRRALLAKLFFEGYAPALGEADREPRHA